MRRKNFGFSFTVCKTEENYDKINLINLFSTGEKKKDKYIFVSPVANKWNKKKYLGIFLDVPGNRCAIGKKKKRGEENYFLRFFNL